MADAAATPPRYSDLAWLSLIANVSEDRLRWLSGYNSDDGIERGPRLIPGVGYQVGELRRYREFRELTWEKFQSYVRMPDNGGVVA